jgi:hypothetical protein
MTITDASPRFTALPDDRTLATTVVALEEHGFGVEVVDDLDASRQAVAYLCTVFGHAAAGMRGVFTVR